MAYYDTIEGLKNALDGYSDDEEKLSALYKNAYDAADKEYQDSKALLDRDYRAERNRVYSDNARDERNTFALLAERGLGFSGEAAQTKLNSNILLSNRLGELSAENSRNNAELDKAHADKKHSLSREYFDKAGSLNDEKNRLRFDIASLEQKAESDEADRLFEKEKFDAQLKAEAEANDKKLKADAEANDKKLKADADALDKKLKADREMLDAELYAKYYAQSKGQSLNNGNSSGGKGTAGSGDDYTLEDILNGYLPDISPKDLAKLMVTNATDDNFINDEQGDYLINKYLLDMFDNYNMDEDYMRELVFMLKAYGFNDVGVSGMRVKVISHDARTYYDESYHSYYNKYAESGLTESEARKGARELARKGQLEYIKSRTNSLSEFLECCKNAGISDSDANEFANDFVWGVSEKQNSSGGGKTNPTISNMLR